MSHTRLQEKDQSKYCIILYVVFDKANSLWTRTHTLHMHTYIHDYIYDSDHDLYGQVSEINAYVVGMPRYKIFYVIAMSWRIMLQRVICHDINYI